MKHKNKAASALGKLGVEARLGGKTKEEISEIMREVRRGKPKRSKKKLGITSV